MAAMPIYGKNSGLGHIIVCSYDDLFCGEVKFGNLGFSIGKSESSGFFRNYCSLRPERSY